MVVKVNKEEYEQLFNKKMLNGEPWGLRNDLMVNSVINEIFKQNKTLWRSIFDTEYNISNNEDKTICIGDLKHDDFNHEFAISLKRDNSNEGEFKTISGIINFPNIKWDDIDNFVSRVPENWKVYILNPLLIRYSVNIGLFLMPGCYAGGDIDLINKMLQSQTGNQLFFGYLDE